MAQARKSSSSSPIELDPSAVEIGKILSEDVELSSDSDSDGKKSVKKPLELSSDSDSDDKKSDEKPGSVHSAQVSEGESDEDYEESPKPANQSKERSLRSSTSVPI